MINLKINPLKLRNQNSPSFQERIFLNFGFQKMTIFERIFESSLEASRSFDIIIHDTQNKMNVKI